MRVETQQHQYCGLPSNPSTSPLRACDSTRVPASTSERHPDEPRACNGRIKGVVDYSDAKARQAHVSPNSAGFPAPPPITMQYVLQSLAILPTASLFDTYSLLPLDMHVIPSSPCPTTPRVASVSRPSDYHVPEVPPNDAAAHTHASTLLLLLKFHAIVRIMFWGDGMNGIPFLPALNKARGSGPKAYRLLAPRVQRHHSDPWTWGAGSWHGGPYL